MVRSRALAEYIAELIAVEQKTVLQHHRCLMDLEGVPRKRGVGAPHATPGEAWDLLLSVALDRSPITGARAAIRFNDFTLADDLMTNQLQDLQPITGLNLRIGLKLKSAALQIMHVEEKRTPFDYDSDSPEAAENRHEREILPDLRGKIAIRTLDDVVYLIPPMEWEHRAVKFTPNESSSSEVAVVPEAKVRRETVIPLDVLGDLSRFVTHTED